MRPGRLPPRWAQPSTHDGYRCPLQELAAALELQRERAARQRAARGGAAAAGPAGSDEEEEEEEGGEQGGAQPAQRPAIYNVDAIHDKLEDIGWVLGLGWAWVRGCLRPELLGRGAACGPPSAVCYTLAQSARFPLPVDGSATRACALPLLLMICSRSQMGGGDEAAQEKSPALTSQQHLCFTSCPSCS